MDVQAGFRKGRGTKDQIANIHWITKKAREFQKNTYFCFTDYTKAFHCVDHSKLWKILKKDGEYQTILPVSWETCMQVKQQQLEPDMEQLNNSKLGKEYDKPIYCHLAYLTYMQSTSWNAGLDESQAGIKVARRNTNNLRYANDTTLMADNEKELKSLFMRVKEETEKASLKPTLRKLR